MRRTITNNRTKPAGYRALPGVRSKPVAGTASSQNARPVGDVRRDPRIGWDRQYANPARTITKKRTS